MDRPNKRLPPTEEHLTSVFTTLYESGSSIRAIAVASGRSPRFVHRLLAENGVVFRTGTEEEPPDYSTLLDESASEFPPGLNAPMLHTDEFSVELGFIAGGPSAEPVRIPRKSTLTSVLVGYLVCYTVAILTLIFQDTYWPWAIWCASVAGSLGLLSIAAALAYRRGFLRETDWRSQYVIRALRDREEWADEYVVVDGKKFESDALALTSEFVERRRALVRSGDYGAAEQCELTVRQLVASVPK